MTSMRRQLLLPFLICLAALVRAPSARAELPTLSGTWNATAMRSDWSIGEWGPACGPPPSGGGAPAGKVEIVQNGSELSMVGAGRNYSTSECWEQFPGLSRTSHSGGARGWKNTCKTKAGDPRQATLVTTLAAGDSSISFDETGQYQFVIKGQNCTASVRRTRSIILALRDGESPPAPPSAPVPTVDKEPAVKDCSAPGSPARLEVRPARKLIRPGESFEFHATVLDEAGCVLSVVPQWRVVTESAAVALAGAGKVTVPADAAEATVELQASVAGRAVGVTVEVASRERYDALLAQSGLNAEGESNDAAVTRIATSTIGAGSAVARDDSQRRRILFVGVVGGAALLLGLLGFVLVQKNRRNLPEPEPEPEPLRGGVGPSLTPSSSALALGKICPTCREEYPPDAGFCPNDGNRLVATRGGGEPAGPGGGVCPVCGQGYDPGIISCPKHGEELVPAAVLASARVSEFMDTKKICPVCGKQYGGESQFCGGCGASLVPVN